MPDAARQCNLNPPRGIGRIEKEPMSSVGECGHLNWPRLAGFSSRILVLSCCRPVRAENLCHLGICSTTRRRLDPTSGARAGRCRPGRGAMISGLWA